MKKGQSPESCRQKTSNCVGEHCEQRLPASSNHEDEGMACCGLVGFCRCVSAGNAREYLSPDASVGTSHVPLSEPSHPRSSMCGLYLREVFVLAAATERSLCTVHPARRLREQLRLRRAAYSPRSGQAFVGEGFIKQSLCLTERI